MLIASRFSSNGGLSGRDHLRVVSCTLRGRLADSVQEPVWSAGWQETLCHIVLLHVSTLYHLESIIGWPGTGHIGGVQGLQLVSDGF